MVGIYGCLIQKGGEQMVLLEIIVRVGILTVFESIYYLDIDL
jgi:hypothetical protein